MSRGNPTRDFSTLFCMVWYTCLGQDNTRRRFTNFSRISSDLFLIFLWRGYVETLLKAWVFRDFLQIFLRCSNFWSNRMISTEQTRYTVEYSKLMGDIPGPLIFLTIIVAAREIFKINSSGSAAFYIFCKHTQSIFKVIVARDYKPLFSFMNWPMTK
jgi:hypothetical protein